MTKTIYLYTLAVLKAEDMERQNPTGEVLGNIHSMHKQQKVWSAGFRRVTGYFGGEWGGFYVPVGQRTGRSRCELSAASQGETYVRTQYQRKELMMS